MDDVIEKLKKLKQKKGKGTSPLEEFFEIEKNIGNNGDTTTESSESDLDIKPLGKTSYEEAPTKERAKVREGTKNSNNISAKGIREFSFDDLEAFAETKEMEKETREEKTLVEIKSQEPQKVKYIKLIIALLEADQYDVALQEIDKLRNI